MTRISGNIQNLSAALCFGVVFSILLLAGCDSAALDGSPADSSTLAGGSDAQARVDVCHANEQGSYTKITIADAAYETHIAHGDGGIGDAVPSMPGYIFTQDCLAGFPVGSAGGTVTSSDGAVTLDIPEGAVDDEIVITVVPGTDDVGAGNMVAGSIYVFGPSPYSFNSPVTLTITYDPDNLSGSVSELGIVKLVNGAWVAVTGSTVNVSNNSASAPIDGFSTYGVGEPTQDPVVASIGVTPEYALVYHTGDNPWIPGTQQFTATVYDQFGEVMEGEDVTWSSSDEDIATVDDSGLATSVGVSFGQAEIIASVGEISGSATLEVQHQCGVDC